MRHLLLIIIALFAPLCLHATEKADADSAYMRENYQEAARLYEELLEQGSNADVYYNLGNCYYRLEKIALSVLNYERALRLNPGDSQVRHNLELARNKTQDKVTPVGEVFIVTWYKSVINLLSVDQWANIGVGAFILMLIMLGVYLFGNQMNYRKIGFYLSLVCLIVCICSNIFAWNQKHLLLNRNAGVVMVPSVAVKSTPSLSGTDLFILHEGTKVFVIDPTMKGWKEIKLGDGKTGWITTESIEII